MRALATQLIGKERLIHTIRSSIIVEGVLREYPKNKMGKKKSVVPDGWFL